MLDSGHRLASALYTRQCMHVLPTYTSKPSNLLLGTLLLCRIACSRSDDEHQTHWGPTMHDPAY